MREPGEGAKSYARGFVRQCALFGQAGTSVRALPLPHVAKQGFFGYRVRYVARMTGEHRSWRKLGLLSVVGCSIVGWPGACLSCRREPTCHNSMHTVTPWCRRDGMPADVRVTGRIYLSSYRARDMQLMKCASWIRSAVTLLAPAWRELGWHTAWLLR